MSVKIKQAITRCLEKINAGTFDEDTIRTLLIVSREYIKYDGLIRELAHFIAHPVRDKGIAHKMVNNRYAKWKLVDDQYHQMENTRPSLANIQNEEELSSFMLGAIDVNSIDAKLFEILYFDGIYDIRESHLKKYTGMNRARALEILKLAYEKKSGKYVLKFNESLTKIKESKDNIAAAKLREPNVDATDLEQKINAAELFFTRQKAIVDNLQKVIRGTIEFRSVFSDTELHKEIQSTVSGLIQQFSIDPKPLAGIAKKKNDILLCIMTLLHDTTFTFYDGNTAKTHLCLINADIEKEMKTGVSIPTTIKSFKLALYITYQVYDKINSIPLFVSNLKASKYINIDKFKTLTDLNGFEIQIPWTTAETCNGKLSLQLT